MPTKRAMSTNLRVCWRKFKRAKPGSKTALGLRRMLKHLLWFYRKKVPEEACDYSFEKEK